MAYVEKRANGMKVERLIALHVDVQNEVDNKAVKHALIAEKRLARRKHDGHARISLEKGDVDSYVVLDDERGLNAVLSIEYGRPKKGDMQPTRILRGAFPGVK